MVKTTGVVVSQDFGADITTWTNLLGSSRIQAVIPNGFYANHKVDFDEPTLLPSNIRTGVSIFGVTGSASSSAPACTDNASNVSACTTTTNRYVTGILGNNITPTNGLLTSSIPLGFYDGTKSCTMTDSSLSAGNIKSGVTVFGVSGTFTNDACDSSLTFSGITSANSITATTATVNWTNSASAKSYIILDVTNSSSPKILNFAISGSNSANISGLSAATSYTIKVRALTTNQTFDCNNATQSFTTSAQITPSDLSGLAYWLKPESLTGAPNDSFISTWTDSSGNNRHFSQATGSQQPIYKTSQLNGYGGVQLDGVDDNLLWGADYASDNFTVMIVAKTTTNHEVDPENNAGVTGTGGEKYLLFPYLSTGTDAGSGISFGNNGISIYEHASGYMPAIAVTGGSFTLPIVITLSYSAKQPSIYVDGALVRTGFTSNRSAVNAPRQIGAAMYGAMAGQIYEIVAFDRALTPTERSNIQTYLLNKFGLSN